MINGITMKDVQTNHWQFPSEFRSDGDIFGIFAKYRLVTGRMISGSKSGYKERFPDHEVIFNANIVTKSRGKIWYGDIDLSIDAADLMGIAKELGESLYVLREMDARFENEEQSFEFYEKKAKAIINNVSVTWQ
jgi:hypothetical protein